MLVNKRVLGLVVIYLYLLPALRCVAILAQRFSLMDILVACDALFKFLNLILFFFMTLNTLNINMLSCKGVFGILVMVELRNFFPVNNIVALAAILIQLPFMDVLMA